MPLSVTFYIAIVHDCFVTLPPEALTFITKDDDTQITTTISRETIPSRYRRRLPSNGMEWPVSVIHSAVGFVGGEFEWGKVDKTTKKKGNCVGQTQLIGHRQPTNQWDI